MAEKPKTSWPAPVARVRASNNEYKRLDEVYDKMFHFYTLKEASTPAAGANDKWKDNIFVIRRKFDWQNKYEKTFVDVKSPELVGVLREVLNGISGVSLREETPKVDPNLLFNYLPQLVEKLQEAESLPEESQNKTLISHLSVLIGCISDDYASTAKKLYPYLAQNEITFDLLWALFLPNTLIYTVCGGSNEPRCLKLDWAEEKEEGGRGKFFRLDCHYLDYDGKTFGDRKAVLEIDEFRGIRRIDSLAAFPLAYHEEEESVREKLVQRGRKFGSLKGMHYRSYKGIAFFWYKKEVRRVNVDSRIMIDPSTFKKINPNYRVRPIQGSCAHSSSGTTGAEYDSENEVEDEDPENDEEEDDINSTNNIIKPKAKPKAGGDSVFPDTKALQKKHQEEAEKKVLETAKKGESLKDEIAPGDMTEEELLICSATLLGFSFGDKIWAEFAVEHAHEIEFSSEAFDSLVLPEGKKEIVRSLVESHTGNLGPRAGIDDVIKGKGKGLVFALHGRPGVGKTLTAEGISEFLKRPLYTVGVGELGTDTRTLERQLSRILDIAHTWGAVLLLDEADIFLERRTIHDLQRNALVSIFLRQLEYFQGILFLTTNRVESFDEAFQSRIHIALRYSDLDQDSRKKVWNTYLKRAAAEEGEAEREIVSSEELQDLSKKILNGRQIKNVVTMAHAVASSQNARLSMEHLLLFLDFAGGLEHDLRGTGQVESMMSYA